MSSTRLSFQQVLSRPRGQTQKVRSGIGTHPVEDVREQLRQLAQLFLLDVADQRARHLSGVRIQLAKELESLPGNLDLDDPTVALTAPAFHEATRTEPVHESRDVRIARDGALS